MLSKMRNSWLLFTLLVLVAYTSALDIGVDGIAEYFHHGKRQAASGTGNSPSSSAAPSTSAPASTPTPTPTPTPTSQPSSEAPSSQAPSSTPPSSAAPSSAAPSSAAPSSVKPTKSTQVSTEIFTSALLGTSVQQYTTVITTVSNGQTQELTSTGSRTLVSTTGQAVITKTPDAQTGGNSGGSGGLSSKNKSIIGGVVGGVGGAILLGGLAIVALRLRTKRRVTEDDADLMAGTGSALGDKPAPQPFQSNLEQYHNPGGRPNAAANF